jgi:hypothetical protein
MNCFVDLEKLPEPLKNGIDKLIASGEYAISAKNGNDALELIFAPGHLNGFSVTMKSDNAVEISYAEISDAFRATATLLGARESRGMTYSEESAFDFRCVQLEASRNGVMTVENVKAFIRRMAMMGINAACLYTEDTYEVEGEPFFGYLRGRYSVEELKSLDDYATDLGIELFPCIQALGHLKQMLQWTTAYGSVTDTDHILLVGEEKTYDLLRKMITSVSSCFRSSRIHVGMDEAHGLGTGEYKRRNGERSSFDIINEHLGRVVDICGELKLRPMIWSDMYFRLGSKTNDYYDLEAEIPLKAIDEIPENLDLVYWDYYHKDQDFYHKFIAKHREMRKEPIVAPAAWTWGRFWCALPYAYDTLRPCMKACRAEGVKEVFLTTWGDDGMEVDLYSALPAFQFFADACYAEEVDRDQLAANLAGSCGIDIEAYEAACSLDSCAKLAEDISTMSNISKWLLWDDPILGLCEPQKQGKSFRTHYANLAEKLANFADDDSPSSKRLIFPAQLAKTLAVKCDMRVNLVDAYKANDKEKLKSILESEVKPLAKELKLLWKTHRNMWLATYKPFGLEVIEGRYGKLILRVESLIDRLEECIKGEIDSIPEFETELLPFIDNPPETLAYLGGYARIATPSAIN